MRFKGFVDLDFSLKDKTALVTGAANGIGKAIVEAFARKGANLVLVDMNDSAREVARSLEMHGGKMFPVVEKLTDKRSVQKIVREALERFPRIDVLVNNAGTSCVATALDFPEDEWDRILNLNLKVPFLLSQALGRHMIENGKGKIINIASQAALVAIDSHLGYAASKAGLLSLTRNMALE
jgi:NAD(P)-dependent dehydrogenase (short-subunit alcohol dehydrogenase family)